MSADAPTQAPPRRRELARWLLGLLALAVVMVGTVVAMGGRIEAATWGLVVAASALVFALHSLYRMATVLSRPAVEVVLEQDDVAALAGVRELREERRRVLRAINELQFDYEMGKLSKADYDKVRQGYQLRAVEVMRALEQQPEVHPRLEVELRRRGMWTEAEAEGIEAAESSDGEAVAESSGETVTESADGEAVAKDAPDDGEAVAESDDGEAPKEAEA